MLMLLILALFQCGRMFKFTNFDNNKISFEQQSKYWVQQDGQDQQQKWFMCEKGVKYFGNISPSYAIIRRFQVPSHSHLFIEFDFYTYLFEQDQELEVFINNQRITLDAKQSRIGSQKATCQNQNWFVNRVKFNLENNQESFYLIFQVTFSQNNNQNQLWGIGNFEIHSNYCEKLFCDEKFEWTYQYRQYFFNNFFNFKGLDKNSRYTFQINPHTKVKIRFLIYVHTIQRDYELKLIQLVNNRQMELWNQIITRNEWDYIENLYYHCEVSAQASDGDLTFVFEIDQNSLIGIRDLIIYSDRCPGNCAKCDEDHKCLICKKGFDQNNLCKPKYIYDNDNYIIQIEKSYTNKIRLNDPISKEKWEDVNGKQYTSLFLNEYLILGGEGILNRQSIVHKKFEFEKNIYYYIRISAEICLKTSNQVVNYPIVWLKSYKETFSYLNKKSTSSSNYEYSFQFEKNDIFKNYDNSIYFIKQIEDKIFPGNGQTYMEIEFKLEYQQQDNSNIRDYWGIRNINIEGILKENSQCALLFTQINYQGESYQICDKVSNFDQQDIPSSIRSLKIPEGGKITLYQKTKYRGKFFVFSKDTPALAKEMYLGDHSQDQINDK